MQLGEGYSENAPLTLAIEHLARMIVAVLLHSCLNVTKLILTVTLFGVIFPFLFTSTTRGQVSFDTQKDHIRVRVRPTCKCGHNRQCG